ncbi:MAG: serine hydroxymethyltransferase [Gammaproteobacteria bacterium]
MFSLQDKIKETDPEIHQAIEAEFKRQFDHLELIASENYVSASVLEAQGSVLTNKYAEGYPGKRYYGGCEYVDWVENLALERVKKLFNAHYANVQPHSGSQANAAVLMALLKPGDVILGMSLSAGGHLTHGALVNFSGQLYHAVQYGVDIKTGLIDYDEVRDLALKHRPKLIIAGFSAYSRIVEWETFRKIADEVGAYLMADMAHVAGLVAAGEYPSPVNIADVTTSTTHKTLRGPRGGIILAKKPNFDLDLEKRLNSMIFPGTQGGPLMHVIAAKAVAFKEALGPEFKIYAGQIIKNAKALAQTLTEQGFNLVSGGTDNHLMLLDLSSRGWTGKEAEKALGQANITVNKNTIPGEQQSPFITSGVRLGTPALTTRGFKEKEMQQVALWIGRILENMQNTDFEKTATGVRAEILELCQNFRVYA